MPNDTQPLDPTVLTHAGPVEIIAPGVTTQWIYDKQILIRRINGTNRDTVDKFIDHVIAFTQSWPLEKKLYVLSDLRGAAFTPYNVKRMHDLMDATPAELHGYSASLIPQGVVGNLMKVFNTTILARRFDHLQQRIFYDEAEALTWLVKNLPDVIK